jgi:hypothetical protein
VPAWLHIAKFVFDFVRLGLQLFVSPDDDKLPSSMQMFALLFDLEDYATTYRATRDAYLKAANELKLATGPYKAARDAYVAATATYTKSLYE